MRSLHIVVEINPSQRLEDLKPFYDKAEAKAFAEKMNQDYPGSFYEVWSMEVEDLAYDQYKIILSTLLISIKTLDGVAVVAQRHLDRP